MKNAMKKLMSLVLVAVLLVSAVPFQASAAGFMVVVTVRGEGFNEYFKVAENVEGSYSYEQCLQLGEIDTDKYEVTSFNASGKNVAAGESFAVDKDIYVYIDLVEKAEDDEPENNGRPGRPGGSVSGRPSGTPESEPEESEPTAYPMSIDVDGEQKVLTDRVSITYEEVLQMTGLKASEIDYIVYEGTGVSGTQFLDAGHTINLAGETRIFVFTEPETEPETQPENNGRPGNDNDDDDNNGRPDNNRPGNNRPGNDDDDDDNNGRPGNNRPGNDNNRPGNNRPGRDDDEGYSKFSNEVWLYIYTGTSIGEPNKRVMITDGIAADGKVTLSEVKSVVKYYYNAVDADTGITYDGIYPMQGGWVEDYIKDRKYNTVDGLYQAAAKQTVILRVMIGNAKPATTTSSNADTTNPKTGDQIYMAITTMAISASVLALGFYFSKKRAY